MGYYIRMGSGQIVYDYILGLRRKRKGETMRKAVAFAVSSALIFGSLSTAFAGNEPADALAAGKTSAVAVCSDIAGTKYEEAVTKLIAENVVSGYPDGTFRPQNKVTRAEAAKMFAVAKHMVLEENQKNTFTDMEAHWAYEPVAAVAAEGVLNGYEDGTFRPDREISYNEAAKILVASLGYTADQLTGTWPDNYRNKADALGITRGLPGKSAGSQSASRGDFALMLYRAVYTELKEDPNRNDPKDSGTEPIELSLEEAVQAITSGGSGYETAVLNKKNNEAAAKLQTETLKALKEYNGGSVPKTYDAKALQRYREYLTGIAPIQYEAEINKLEYDAVSAYFSVVKMENTLRIARENLQAKQTILENAQKKYKAGTAAKADVTTAEGNVKTAAVGVEQAESGLAALRMAFNITMGYDVMRDVTLTDKLEKIDAPQMNLLQDIEAGKTNQLMAYQLRYALQEAEWELKSKASTYPKDSATYRIAEIGLLEAEKNLKDGMKGIEMTIRSNYRSITNGETSIASAENALNLAKETYRISLVSYNAGTGTMSDLQQAQLYVNQCETELEAAVADYNLAVYNYKYAVGAGTFSTPSAR